MMMMLLFFIHLMLMSTLAISSDEFVSRKNNLLSLRKKLGNDIPPKWTNNSMKIDLEVVAEPINSMVRLKCPARGQPRPLISWFKDGVEISSLKHKTSLPSSPYRFRPEKWQLIILRLSILEEGHYTCVITNEAGSLNKTFKIEALNFLTHVPILIEQSPNQTVMIGMSVQLMCRFKSDLAAITHWVRPQCLNLCDNTSSFDQKDKNSFITIVDENGAKVIGDVLFIKSVKLEDAGLYFCVGQTNSGLTPGFLNLNVLSPDKVLLSAPHNTTVEEGKNAVFSCQIHLKLHQHITWIRKTSYGDVQLRKGTEVLSFKNVTKKDAGTYACVVGTNSTDIIEAKATLNVISSKVSSRTRLEKLGYTEKLQIIIGSVFVFLLVLLLVIFVVFQRFQADENEKKKKAMKNAKAVHQWTKRVVIEHHYSDFENAENGVREGTISTPNIRIEKKHGSLSSSVSTSNRSRLGSETFTMLTGISEYEIPLDPMWEFPRNNLAMGGILGEGAFGRVVYAEAKDLLIVGRTTKVAVKMLKEGHTDAEMIDLVSEMDMMKSIGKHINIINMLGVCTQAGPLLVLVEYAEHGNLRAFLRKHALNEGYERPNSSKKYISEKQLYSFARQICKGMEYLSNRKCIHRDLAARNVLVASELVIKIADFGLARNVHTNDYYRKQGDGRLPVKWMAPESLFQRVYTLSSDIWSFGILLWEITTLGASPYPSVPSIEKLFQLLKQGYRMEPPEPCLPEIYSIMKACWHADPTQRPLFHQLVQEFDRIIMQKKDEDTGDYLNMNRSGSNIVDNDKNEVNNLCSTSNMCYLNDYECTHHMASRIQAAPYHQNHAVFKVM